MRQAICLPAEAVSTFFALAVLFGRPAVGMAILHCFCGLLRAREALGLRTNDIVVGPKGVILCLGRIERGVEERVVLTKTSQLNV